MDALPSRIHLLKVRGMGGLSTPPPVPGENGAPLLNRILFLNSNSSTLII